MAPTRLLLDTSYFIGILNGRDQHHAKATDLMPTVDEADGVWITESVLTELGNAFATYDEGTRLKVCNFIDALPRQENVHVIEVDTDLFRRGLDLYKRYADKDCGLTDCISFVVMRDCALTDAVTTDDDFVQVGFGALMI